ncbi:MAG TPA: hypothetical protein VE263_18810, partial [Candidatus Angelobacter sp.]|nr:hypothetical protein [Candidatus Angelobacter sp.]
MTAAEKILGSRFRICARIESLQQAHLGAEKPAARAAQVPAADSPLDSALWEQFVAQVKRHVCRSHFFGREYACVFTLCLISSHFLTRRCEKMVLLWLPYSFCTPGISAFN